MPESRPRSSAKIPPAAASDGQDRRSALLARYRPRPGHPKAEYHPAADDAVTTPPRKQAWDRFRFIDLFAGIGGFRVAFERVGGRCVFSSEWDEAARTTYEANFGERPHGDITRIPPDEIPDHDVLCAGFPCQPFSIIGDRKGFGDTRGTLFFTIEEILRVRRPSAILLENVRQFRTHDGGRTYRTVIDRLARLGYFTHTAILNALHYGVPQLRQRTFIAGFRADLAFQFPAPLPEIPDLGRFLEDDAQVDPKLFASGPIRMKRLERLREQGVTPFYPSIWHENKGGFIGLLPFSCALRHNASHNYMLVNGRRRPSGRECLRLQGFPDDFRIVVPHRAIRAQAGNSVAVPCVEAIARQMLATLRSALPRHAPDLFARGIGDDR
jgi:DNA (cytosine-5)-methyltransferase 1